MTGGITGAFYAIGGIIVSFLLWLFLLATREFIFILINIEENTRGIAERVTREPPQSNPSTQQVV